MFSRIENNKLDESRSSITISYLRDVNIIYGNFPYPDVTNNLIIAIKNNLSKENNNYTNVKGGMTQWNHFNNDPLFKKFLAFMINKHQVSHPHLFQYFLEKNSLIEAWGNEFKPGDAVNYHTHNSYHCVLYLTEGCDLNLPELNLKITPKPGDYYIFPPELLHGFDKYEGNTNRYSLVFNFISNKGFEFLSQMSK